MKITIESTRELAHANGLPVRVWTGTTERGTPILALITRVAVPPGADASELEQELSEPPTRVVDPGGAAIASPRACTVCLARDVQRPATHVARDPAGLEWFECGEHEPTDNLAETVRVALEPIATWFDRHEIPLPPGVYRGPASEREPWASIIAGLDDDGARFAAQPATAQTHGQPALGIAARQALDRMDRTAAEQRVLDAMARARISDPSDGFPVIASLHHEHALCRAELARRECRPLRSRLKDGRETSWLVKDFWALYKAADASLKFVTLAESAESRAWLELQLARMRSAFEACEAERHGAPDRLTAAEREALAALHRWLHSPGGDCELTDAAQPYHDQVEGECPADCERLEAEETLAYADVRMARREPRLPHEVITAIVDNDHAGESVFVLNAMRGAQSGWHAKHAHPDQIALAGRRGAPRDDPARSAWLTGFRLGAGLDPAADLAEDETPPAPEVFELTDALREQARELSYRAPETLSARDRALIAACEADETTRAKSPETWLGGER